MLEELRRRNPSPITIRIYLRAVEEFTQFTKPGPAVNHTHDDVVALSNPDQSAAQALFTAECDGHPLHRCPKPAAQVLLHGECDQAGRASLIRVGGTAFSALARAHGRSRNQQHLAAIPIAMGGLKTIV